MYVCMYINNIFIVYDNLTSVENVITLDKLIGLLFLFCLPLLSILLLKTKRNDLARPVMGTIFLVVCVLKGQCAMRTPFNVISSGRSVRKHLPFERNVS